MDRPYRVLFLCPGNAARSLMAEALLNQLGRGRFIARAAGGEPGTGVHPLVVEELRHSQLPAEGLQPRDWHDYAGREDAAFDFVFKLCDESLDEDCPWPCGDCLEARWRVPDPQRAGDEPAQRRAFHDTLERLRNRIALLVSLPPEGLDRLCPAARLASSDGHSVLPLH